VEVNEAAGMVVERGRETLLSDDAVPLAAVSLLERLPDVACSLLIVPSVTEMGWDVIEEENEDGGWR